MKVLLAGRWRDVALDPHRDAGAVRVQVLAWLPLARLDDLAFRRPRSVRLVWNYLREIGLRATLDKIASRHQERFRNDACIAAGVGRVLEAPVGSGLAAGALVELLAPRHPLGAERVVLARELIRAASPGLAGPMAASRLLLLPRLEGELPADLAAVAGWAPEAGERLSPELLRRAFDRARAALLAAPWEHATALDVATPSAIAERRTALERPRPAAGGATLSAALFGYGNYAKTAILPSLPRQIRVTAVHEIDPLQVPLPGSRRARGVAWDTSPVLRPGERPDVVFAAGFHHTHAALAVAALERGAVAVVEKPLATTHEQLERLAAALRPAGRRLFACFHKRYSPLNELARRDLGVAPGEPVSYHAIVYEVPLPARHWYRWPASRSRIVSNGCHWLDHFLFLNDYAEVRDTALSLAPDGTTSCSVALANGAFLTLALTDRGSERLGVQEHVELRAGGVTVAIENGWRYRAEGRDRVLRRCRINRLEAYRRMYAAIGRAIVAGAAGDSLRSVEVSAGLALRLEDEMGARLVASARASGARAVQRRSAAGAGDR